MSTFEQYAFGTANDSTGAFGDPVEPDLLDPESADGDASRFPSGDLAKDLTIDETAIDAEFISIAGLVARWTGVAGVYAAKYDRAKATAEAKEAALYLRVKRELLREGAKPTEKLIEATMKATAEWSEIQDELLLAAKTKAAAAAMAKGVTSKAEALISLGAYKRQEMKHLEPRIRDHNHPLFAASAGGSSV